MNDFIKGREILLSATEEMGISLSERQIEIFEIYCEEILRWNKRINLVSIKKTLDIWIKHFADSITAAPYIPAEGKLLDLGSGAGFPGIPLKIILCAADFYLVEASRKRVSFLKHIIRKLELERVCAVHRRIEDLRLDTCYRDAFQTVISRASFKLPDLIRASAPFLSENGRLVAMKGPEFQKEFGEAASVLSEASMRFCGIHHHNLPSTGDERKILIYQKYLQ